jgi:RND family efflux transporter MFP subunit
MPVRRPTALRALVLASLMAAGLQGCSEEKPPPPAPPRMARVMTVHLTASNLGGQASGVIDSRYNTQLGFLVGGRLIERKVDIGAIVKKGDVLAQLDASDYQNKLAAAESQVRAAEGEIGQAAPQEERLRTLLKKGYTTQVEYDRAMRNLSTAKADLEAAQANVRLAQDQVNYTILKADNDGAVTAVGADPGQVVNAGQMIVQVSQLDAREGAFAISEKAAAYLKPGMIIRVALQSDPKVSLDGAVREISPNADPVTRTYQLKVALPDAPEAMRLGAVVTGTLDVKGDMVAVIPTGALLQTGEQAAVWVVDPAAGTVHRRRVKVQRFDAESVTIASGLKDGDIIVTAGINSLAEGEKVRLPQEASQ